MRRSEAIRILSEQRADLATRFHVQSLGIFGSTARDEAHAGSDVDVLVEFAPNAPVSLFDFVRLQRHLEALLGSRVDLVEMAALKPQLRERVLRELVRAA